MFSLLYILRTAPHKYSEVDECKYRNADRKFELAITILGFIISVIVAITVSPDWMIVTAIVAGGTFIFSVVFNKAVIMLRERAWCRMLETRTGVVLG